MSRRIAGRVGVGCLLAGAFGLVVGGPGIVAGRGDQASATVTIDPATELRVRALADAATLGVSGVGCDGLLRGSGFVVGDTAYTNRHLVEGGEAVKFDQAVEPIVQPISALAADLDVATAPAVSAVRLEFAEHNPAIGSIVFVAGHAGGNETEVLQGTVHLYGDGATWGVDGNVMLIDVETVPGFSGGPVLDVDGRVVAMLQGMEPTIGLTIAIPVEDLRTWSAIDQEATPERCQR
ncbi:MAG: serine protease [Acidimicrobiales bacterium]